jgi:hypothetical protein
MDTPGEAPPQAAHGAEIHQEADRIAFGTIILVAAASVVVFSLGVVWAYGILRAGGRPLRGPGSVAGAQEIGRPEIGMVDQVPFDKDHRIDQSREESVRWLESYGWVDRRHGVIHIPIDEAMERVLREGQGRAPGRAPAKGGAR